MINRVVTKQHARARRHASSKSTVLIVVVVVVVIGDCSVAFLVFTGTTEFDHEADTGHCTCTHFGFLFYKRKVRFVMHNILDQTSINYLLLLSLFLFFLVDIIVNTEQFSVYLAKRSVHFCNTQVEYYFILFIWQQFGIIIDWARDLVLPWQQDFDCLFFLIWIYLMFYQKFYFHN